MPVEKEYVIGPFRQIVSQEKIGLKGAVFDDQLTIYENAGLVIKEGKITAIGCFDELAKNRSDDEVDYIFGSSVVLPSFVDCHTHICFSGSRARDYALRNSGKSYLEIAQKGGGIWDTVTQTRRASREQLIGNIINRANTHLEGGVTTIEVKSGYGLTVHEELKMLYAIQASDKKLPVDLVATCLAAHILPKDFRGDETAYLRYLSENLFPIILEKKLSNRIDIFIEKTAFSKEQSLQYFIQAKEKSFDLIVHADQFSEGGSELAVKFGALSADHLEATTQQGIERLAKSSTIAVALPGASIGLGCAFTPSRKILDMGGALAIASDWNPGSAPMGDLLLQACILATFEKLSNAEVLAGITFRAAEALNLRDRGKLTVGEMANFNIFPVEHYNEIFYNQGKIKPVAVYKSGKKIYSKYG